jgi:hypothetical protein
MYLSSVQFVKQVSTSYQIVMYHLQRLLSCLLNRAKFILLP